MLRLMYLVLALAVFQPVPMLAQDEPEANALMVEAVQTFRASDREADRQQVRELFDRILADYPESRAAAAIRNNAIPGVDVIGLPPSPLSETDTLPDEVMANIEAEVEKIANASSPANIFQSAVTIVDYWHSYGEISDALPLIRQTMALTRWSDVLTTDTMEQIRATSDAADAASNARIAAVIGPILIKAILTRYVDDFIRERANDAIEDYLIGGLHESVDASFAVLTGSPIAYGLGKTAEVLVELEALGRENAALVEQSITYAQMQLHFLETVPSVTQALVDDYWFQQHLIATDLMTGNGLNVDTGRRLFIVNALMQIRARQLGGRDASAEIALINTQIAEFDQTPGTWWDQWVRLSNFGRDGMRDYAGFAVDTAERLDVSRPLPEDDSLEPTPVEDTAEDAAPPASNPDPLASLRDGIYGRSAASCEIDRENIGDQWGYHFKNLRKPEYSVGYETSCSIRDTTLSGDTVSITAACNAEGSFVDRTDRWQVLTPTSFRDLGAYDGPIDYVLCEAHETPEPQAQWTAAIVHDENNYDPCIFNPDDACLDTLGVSDDTRRFVVARRTEGGEGPIIPVAFQELGQVDIAHLQTYGSAGTFPYFVNTAPETITYPQFPDSDLRRVAQFDRVAASLLRAYPHSFGWYRTVNGMRILPNGHQRFSLATYYTEDCRACPVIGVNLASVDYDANGRFRAYQSSGMLDLRRFRDWRDHSARDLQSGSQLIQYYLNVRGYNAGRMDGAIGPRSRAALAEFQREQAINPGTGQADIQTLTALADRSTLFNNGFEGMFTSDTQESAARALPNCGTVGRRLTSSEVIQQFNGRTFATITDAASTPIRKRVGPLSGEGVFTTYHGIDPSGRLLGPDQVRVVNGQFCVRNSQGEFCSTVDICASGETLYVMTPYGGTVSYVSEMEDSAAAANSCDAPEATLSREEIIAAFSGVSADTREGSGRYVHRAYGVYDGENDLGFVTFTSEYQGRMESFERIYVIEEGRLCALSEDSEHTSCDTVKRCDYGDGLRLGLFDPGGRISVRIGEMSSDTSDASAGAADRSHIAPEGHEWLQIASRLTLAEARQAAAETGRTDGSVRIFRARNGWYAITGGLIALHHFNDASLARLIRERRYPPDSFLFDGSTYVEEVPLTAGGAAPTPAFTYTTVLRDTPVYGEFYRDGELVRVTTNDVLRANSDVLVWGRDGDNCLIAYDSNATVSCSDIAGFEGAAPAPAPAAAPQPQPSAPTDAQRAAYERAGGDAMVDRIIAATTWDNSPDQRALLADILSITASDSRRLSDLERLSRLVGILSQVETRVGAEAGTFQALNYARNARMGAHPSHAEVNNSREWDLTDHKDFHVIGINDPERVEKYVTDDGSEAVFLRNAAGTWEPLQDGTNDATYNFVPNGWLNDTYQHMFLDVVPWIIWGATPRDQTSISQRIAAFEASPITRRLSQALALADGTLPDGDPVTTNDTSGMVYLTRATSPELAALLLAFGVQDENVNIVDGGPDDRAETTQLISEYQSRPPRVQTPGLPAGSAGYNAEEGYLGICTARQVVFPEDQILGGQVFGGQGRASIILVPSDPITGLGNLPALCSVNMSQILRVEALHGTGELERFGLTNPSGLALRFRMSADHAARFVAASQAGTLRLTVDCEMQLRERQPYVATPYDYHRIGTCILHSVTLRTEDRQNGSAEMMSFSAGGRIFQATSGLVISTTPEPAAAEPAAEVLRAAWSFETDDTGESAVREIVEGFAGTTAEVILGYENAFPFQTEPDKRLAVAIFQNLPENEVATQSGSQMGYGSYVIKSWSELNETYFQDEPEPGKATAIIGTIDDVRILSVRELAASSCEWSVTYRIWLTEPTAFGTALAAASTQDGFTFEACFRTSRSGYDIASFRYVDPT